jgi:DNA-binding XRE family transcriptional regulator
MPEYGGTRETEGGGVSAAEWVPRDEAAAVTGYHIKTIDRLRKEGKVPWREGPRLRPTQPPVIRYVHLPSLVRCKAHADAMLAGGHARPKVMLPSRTKLGTALQGWRLARGWTQGDVGKALGCDKKVVSTWERGQKAPSVRMVVKLCDLYDLDYKTRWSVIEAIAWKQDQE